MEEEVKRKLAKMLLKGVQAFCRIDKAKQLFAKDKSFVDCCTLFQAIDSEGEGSINEQALVRFCQEMRQPFTKPQVAYIFKMFPKQSPEKLVMDEFTSIVYPGAAASSLKGSSNSSEKSVSGSSKAAAKIDFCLFLKVFFNEHNEMDQTIKQVQSAPLEMAQLFALLQPNRNSYVDSKQLLDFVRDYAELSSLPSPQARETSRCSASCSVRLEALPCRSSPTSSPGRGGPSLPPSLSPPRTSKPPKAARTTASGSLRAHPKRSG
jgi:hypothetical protein